MTVFIFRGLVVSRYRCLLSSIAIQHIRSELSDYYGADDDSDITVIQY